MQKIKVKIKPDGTIEYGVSGIKGKSCKDVTKFIDNMSGGEILETQNTGEFCQVETNKVQTKN